MCGKCLVPLPKLRFLQRYQLKYTFINPKDNEEKTIDIDDAWISKQCQLLRISKREAIEMWLFDEGYISDDTVDELTAKAKENKCGIRNAGSGQRKKPTRKPDETKRMLMKCLYEFVGETLAMNGVENAELVNPERMIAFAIGDDKYELTLSKKRKPKN